MVVGGIIGGTSAGASNVISGNATGVQVQASATNTTIQGNRIGVSAAGTDALPNTGNGVTLNGASTSSAARPTRRQTSSPTTGRPAFE